MNKIALLALTVIALGACNTIEGMGKDVSSAARGVKETLPAGNSSNSSYDSSVQSSGTSY
jgi:predicted small secreted protein